MSLTAPPEVCPNPVRQPVMVQRWADLAYLHWQVDEREVRDQLPAGLYPDLHEGAAWVGLVPFEMRGLRVRGTPPLPWVRRFVEVNVRTYVRDESGRPGVWFHSLDASRLGATIVARLAFGLLLLVSRSISIARREPTLDGDATGTGAAPRPLGHRDRSGTRTYRRATRSFSQRPLGHVHRGTKPPGVRSRLPPTLAAARCAAARTRRFPSRRRRLSQCHG